MGIVPTVCCNDVPTAFQQNQRLFPVAAILMHFQDIISTLNRFWADQGCLLLQPYDTEKGAGTMSPPTVLRAIGPEPWAVA